MKIFLSTFIELSDLDWFMVDVCGVALFLLVVGLVLIKGRK